MRSLSCESSRDLPAARFHRSIRTIMQMTALKRPDRGRTEPPSNEPGNPTFLPFLLFVHLTETQKQSI